LFDLELTRAKKNSAMAFVKPNGLFTAGELLGKAFGGRRGGQEVE
jgi:hypothetical protein